MADSSALDGAKEAVKTYIEQTKLLVTLSSAFVLAPPGAVAVFKDWTTIGLSRRLLTWFLVADGLFIFSILMGYAVLGTLAGYQHLNQFNVHRPATRWCSLLQFFAYFIGLAVFIYFAFSLVTAPVSQQKS
jgi:hypothetical protein